MQLKDRNKNKTTLDRTDYSDSEPIIQHQDNNGIFMEEENFLNSKIDNENQNGGKPTLADLEFGSAFGSNKSYNNLSNNLKPTSNFNFSTNLNEIKNEHNLHPTPSSIFDDL